MIKPSILFQSDHTSASDLDPVDAERSLFKACVVGLESMAALACRFSVSVVLIWRVDY
jgi:hypothetical protein